MAKPKGRKTLTPKQRRFAAKVVTADSATQAAIEAGYSPDSARSIASENLTKPNIQDAIQAAAEKAGIDPEYVLRGLKANAERAMQYEEVRRPDGEGTGEFRYEGQVANKAYELMGKALGVFKERHEHSGPDGGPVQVAEIRRTVIDPKGAK